LAERRKRLIDVAFPLEEVSAHSRHEKNVRHGHISTLHMWWARRPLAACRAFIYASLIDDPETDREREELLKEIADLSSWDAVRKPDIVIRSKPSGSGLTGRALLERARKRILECNAGKPPRLLDPFAGGGAIPLEALRLGCEVQASDLNPVAVLILKGTVEYPEKYGRPLDEQAEQKRKGERDHIAGVDGDVPKYINDAATSDQKSFFDGDIIEAYRKNPLATDVRYWGRWMREQACNDLAEFYPLESDGSIPVAYLWSRTVPCPNCGAEMPLIRQYWLARKANKKVALQPVIDRVNTRVEFEVVEGVDVAGNPGEATASLGDTACLVCRQVMQGAEIRKAAKSGKMAALMTTAIVQSEAVRGKRYRAATDKDRERYRSAETRLGDLLTRESGDGLSFIPDEPMPSRAETTGGVVSAFGLDTYGKLFNSRQLLSLTTFVELVKTTYAAAVEQGVDAHYATAIADYLGLAVGRLVDRASTLCRWDSTGESIMGTFGRQALPMVWDYVEVNPFSGMTGDFVSALEWISGYLDGANVGAISPPLVQMRDARVPAERPTSIVVTDPPYYDAINYSNLSDFFYVWLKRSLGFLHPDLLLLPLTPKREQIVMNPFLIQGPSAGRREAARRRYVEGMAEAFSAISASLDADGQVGIVFAHTDPAAWGTLIEGLLDAKLIPNASWPIDTELENKVSRLGQARLSTSVWMACGPRHETAAAAFLDDVIREMRPTIRERLLYFWSKGIRGADFFISAIGPALSVFGRHTKVMYPDGKDVSVRDFLDLVRRESTEVALEQVLGGQIMGQVDSLTRQYVTWVWGYSRAPLDAGEAIALCLATGADYGEVVREGSIAAEAKEKSKKMVKLRTIKERGEKEDELGVSNGARPVPLIDQLQRAAYLWYLNKTDQLAAYRQSLGESRWTALRTLGQAVAECLPEGDDDRRLIHGLLGSNVMATTPREDRVGAKWREQPGKVKLPGFEKSNDDK